MDPSQVDKARKSRDWLLSRIAGFSSDTTFPKLYPDKNLHYGSFARRTKIRPLDDIDIIVTLSGHVGHYQLNGSVVKVILTDFSSPMNGFLHDETNFINSKKVINRFKSGLESIGHYRKSEIHRNQEAITLQTVSQDWCFDVVPGFFTKEDSFGRTFYIIPDGNGHWKMTDPRIDRDRLVQINNDSSGVVFNLIRILKYWNLANSTTTISSYLFENIILSYFVLPGKKIYSSYYANIPALLQHIAEVIHSSVSDPAGIQGNLNNVDAIARGKISAKAREDAMKGASALQNESWGNHSSALKLWREIFGVDFI